MVRRATEIRAGPMERMISQRVAGTGAVQKKPAVRETRADKLRRERIRAKAEGKTTTEAKSGRAFARARVPSQTQTQPQPPPPPLHPTIANFKRGANIAKPVNRPMPKLPLRATNEAEESWEESEAANVEEESFVQSAAHKERILKKGLTGPLTGRASTMGGGSRRLSVFGKRTLSTTASAKKPSASITFIGRASEASRTIFANAGRPFSRPSLAPQTNKEKKTEEVGAGPSTAEPRLPSPPPPTASKVPTPPNSPHAFFSAMSRSELARWRNALDEIWEEKKSPVRVRRTPGKQKGVTFARFDASSEENEQRHSPAKIPAASSYLRSCFTPGRQPPLNPRLSVVEDVEEDDATPPPPQPQPQAPPPPSIPIPIIISPASDSVHTASTAETTANESQILFTLNPDNSAAFHTLLSDSTLGTDVTLADTTLTATGAVTAMHLSAATNSTAASATPKANSTSTGTTKRGTPGDKSPKGSRRSSRSRAGKKSLDGTALADATVDMSSQGQGLVESGQPLAESTLLAPGTQRPPEPPMDLSPINPPPPRRSSRHIKTPDRYGRD